jgi:hypothetical protein
MSSRDNIREWALPTIHASRNLASLLVAPADWGKVSFIIHETAVEEGLDVRTGRSDMDLAAQHEFKARFKLEIDVG